MNRRAVLISSFLSGKSKARETSSDNARTRRKNRPMIALVQRVQLGDRDGLVFGLWSADKYDNICMSIYLFLPFE